MSSLASVHKPKVHEPQESGPEDAQREPAALPAPDEPRTRPATAPPPATAETPADAGSASPSATATAPTPNARRRRRPAPAEESEASVPKMKSHKGAQKRIGVTGSGKVVRVKAWRGHHLEIKSSRRTRRYAGKAVIGPEQRAGPSPAAVPLGARDGTRQARRHRPQAPQAPAQRAEGRKGTARKLIKPAREAQLHAMAYATRDRKQRKRQMRELWIVRINAAARQNGLTYGKLIAGLKKADVGPRPQDPGRHRRPRRGHVRKHRRGRRRGLTAPSSRAATRTPRSSIEGS